MRNRFHHLRRLGGENDGFTLVELLVYCILLVVILAIAGGMLISAITSQRDIASLGTASSTGQEVAQNINQDVRNASSVTVGVPTAFGQSLSMRTALVTGATVVWRCRAYFLTATGSLYLTTSTTLPIVIPVAVLGLASWTKLADGVALAPTATQAFTSTGTGTSLQVAVNVDVAGGNGKAVRIATATTVGGASVSSLTGTGAPLC
jgi:hypothetical protein